MYRHNFIFQPKHFFGSFHALCCDRHYSQIFYKVSFTYVKTNSHFWGKQLLLLPLLCKQNLYHCVLHTHLEENLARSFQNVFDKCSRVLNLVFSRNWIFHQNHLILGYHTTLSRHFQCLQGLQAIHALVSITVQMAGAMPNLPYIILNKTKLSYDLLSSSDCHIDPPLLSYCVISMKCHFIS